MEKKIVNVQINHVGPSFLVERPFFNEVIAVSLSSHACMYVYMNGYVLAL